MHAVVMSMPTLEHDLHLFERIRISSFNNSSLGRALKLST